MDKKEILDILDNAKDERGAVPMRLVRQAFDKLPTIQPEKAQLSQEDATFDLISRQAARHALCKAVHKGEDVPCENQTASCLWTGTRVCDFVREIDALPPIQPEPKKGHWIKHIDPFGGEQYECSECGVLWEFNDGSPEDNEAYFCPKCGKKLITK